MSRDDTQCFKGMAILLMLIFHVFSQGGNMEEMRYIFLNKDILYRFSMGSQLCVSIFIFITAYGTTMQYRQKRISTAENIAKYGGGRYIRLMSEYWFVYIAAFLFAIYKKNITEVYGRDHASVLYVIYDFFGVANRFSTPTLNSSWWFMQTAITLIFVMPFFIKFMGKMGLIGGMAFCLATYYVSNMGFAEYFFVIILGVGLAYCDGVAVFLDKFDSTDISKKRKAIIIECIVSILIIYYRDTFIGNRVITNPLWTTILALMCCLLVRGSVSCKKFLLLLGKHATNMWLVHVFIYYTYYSYYIYMWKYPAVILCFLIGVSPLVSMGLEFLKKLIKYDCFFKWVCLKYERLVEKLVLITC